MWNRLKIIEQILFLTMLVKCVLRKAISKFVNLAQDNKRHVKIGKV